MLACLRYLFLAPISMPSAVQVKQLLDEYLAQFTLAPVLSEAELAHALLPADDVVSSYVVAAEGECLHDVTGQCAALQCVAEMLLCSKCPWSCGWHMGRCLPAAVSYRPMFSYYLRRWAADRPGELLHAAVERHRARPPYRDARRLPLLHGELAPAGCKVHDSADRMEVGLWDMPRSASAVWMG